ncbi:GTPase activating protein [Cryptococcus neoformans Tu259-1]|uniref:GTPase activating protein n=1 Tax=Cryptococcus neoformans Tu259-1 TaxID=1230072 RepID=A0A854QAW5_CRYNE|nr:GTPase activating protein [Cryptococcus neoformans var. grubii AD1-83a]OXG18359.1 GTPase activating protein [Cryptococcus neoformans var. grubii Tu259-1]OXG56257.1 GTPase activating protein [Cryptococcus neoformans var. grubii MW-RSA1955]OXG60084.1 GTPase activating protein [Cryptococcus neoformans var. grubii CHC193]OXG61750.1 GTPase activating protein [Cryptococcus neoformans var. grubii c8]OXH08206.1 GTPase activating protein [Cryptococcus neoformans var. grubii A5-35-17]OXH09698.1 GTPa
MEQYKDDYVDGKHPEDDSYSFGSRQYSLDVPQSSQPQKPPSPVKPPLTHNSSSTSSNPTTSSQYDHYSAESTSALSAQSIQPTQSAQSSAPTATIRASTANERRMSVGLGTPGGLAVMGGAGQRTDEAVPVGFDEGILRGLCEMDCALPLLADRIKQSIASCKQVATFFRSRAEIEEKYARSLIELTRTTGDIYSRADCKAGTFVAAYNSSLKVQDQISQNRLRFAQRLYEMSEELQSLAREGEKARKTHKETGVRYQLIIQDAESVVEKSKSRLDSIIDDLDRVLAAKEGEALKDVRSGGAYNTVGGPAYGGAPSSNMNLHNGGGKSKLGKAMKTGGLLFKGKGAGSLQKQEDDSRAKMDQANETFTKAVAESMQLRKEYFNYQLPRILRILKEAADELDMGTQYHLTRYAFLYETMTVGDGTVLNSLGSPEEGSGLKAIFENIDNRTDFKSYMQNYAVAKGTPRGPRREGPYDQGYQKVLPAHVQRSNDALATSIISPQHASPQPQPSPQGPQSYNYTASPQSSIQSQLHASSQPSSQNFHYPNSSITSTGTANTNNTLPSIPQQSNAGAGMTDQSSLTCFSHEGWVPPGIPASTGATFGVDLGEQLLRDGAVVPKIVEKCTQAIEMYGLESVGVYRLSGTTSRVQALKAALDKDVDAVDILSDEWSADINVVCGALKLWFRELPEPLLTYGLYNAFIEAARYDNDRLRHIRLHEQVNELPDPNYATLKFFMGHLDRIRRKESINQMSVSNLSIVFGPTLLGAPPEEGGLNLEHMSFQCKAIETILDKYHEIFVEEEDDGEQQS